MNKNINLSIIVPHFNSADSLDKLLESIENHEDVEIIVVDDKSTTLLQELEKCKQKYVSNNVIFLKNITQQKGAGASRNIGLQKAKGKWLLFADADDLFIEKWYQITKKYFDSTTDIVFFPPIGKSNRQRPYEQLVIDYLQVKPNSENRLRLQFFPPWSKLIKYSLIKEHKIAFDETLYANDVLFSTKCGFYANKITAAYTPIYCLLEKENSLTKNKNFDALYIRSEVICRTYQFLNSNLSNKIFKICYIRNAPLADLWTLIKGKYSFKQINKTYKLYRMNHIPIVTSGTLKKIIHYLYKHL